MKNPSQQTHYGKKHASRPFETLFKNDRIAMTYSVLLCLGFLVVVIHATTTTARGTMTCESPRLTVPSSAWPFHAPPVVIAHRGASAHLPEHTLAAYRLALSLGADYIEPDLVPTKDGELIAMHSVDISITTNVDEIFPDRQTYSEFLNRTGYWTYEFTLEEIKQLRVVQRLPAARPTTYDGLFEVPTLTEILELVDSWQKEISPQLFNNTLRYRSGAGVYAELKDTTHIYQDTGINLVDLFFDHIDKNEDLWQSSIIYRMCHTKKMKEYEYNLPPIIIQSFDNEALKEFHERWKERNETLVVPPGISLMEFEDCREDGYWFELVENYRPYISGIGPDKECIRKFGRDVVQRAEKWNWVVHPWTIRPELHFSEPTSEREELIHLFCEIGVHGVFSESVSEAVAVASMDCPSALGDTPGKKQGSHSIRPSQSTATCPAVTNFSVILPLLTLALGVLLGAVTSTRCSCLRRTQAKGGHAVLSVHDADESAVVTVEQDDEDEEHTMELT